MFSFDDLIPIVGAASEEMRRARHQRDIDDVDPDEIIQSCTCGWGYVSTDMDAADDAWRSHMREKGIPV